MFLVAAGAGMATALIGCGGGTKQDPHKILDQTFSGNRGVKSGKVDVRVRVDAQGIPGVNGPVTITLTGPFQREERRVPKFDLDAMLGAGGRTLTTGAVSTGDKGFIKFQGSSYAVPDGIFAGFTQGFEQARSRSLGIDPRKWMRDPKIQGEEDVTGQATIHVSSPVDVVRLLDDRARILQQASRLGVARDRQVSTSLTAQQKQAVASVIADPTLDVYSGKHDNVLRRLTFAFAFKVPKDQQQRANGLKSGKVTLDVKLADVNRPEAVRAPGTLKPFKELRGALNVLAGLPGLGLLVSPGQVTSTSPGTSGERSATVRSYAQCVTAAGGDVSKEQACAPLLPGR